MSERKMGVAFCRVVSSFPKALGVCSRRRHGASIGPGRPAPGARACGVHRRSRAERPALPSGFFPLFIALEGGLDGLELALFLGLIAPMGAALLASRSGRLGAARLVSALSLVIAVTVAAFLSGGVFSPAIAWLVLAPVEALEHPSRREAVIISLAAILGAVALALSAACGWTPVPSPSSSVIAPALVVTALIFATYEGAEGKRSGRHGGTGAHARAREQPSRPRKSR